MTAESEDNRDCGGTAERVRIERLEAELRNFDNGDPQVQPEVLDMLARLAPFRAAGARKLRIGGRNDGGYVMVDDFADLAGAYSIGVGGDCAWDLDIAARGIDVFQFDHEIAAPPATHDRLFFSPLGLAATEDAEKRVTSLDRMLQRNGHAEGAFLLKIDIENDEWDVLASLDPAILRVFRQIVIELHWFERALEPLRRSIMQTAIRTLTRHHRVVHVHGNNFAPWTILAGVPVPRVLELTLLRDDGRWRFSAGEETYPTALDAPNRPDAPDHQLGLFRFSAPAPELKA